VCGDGMFVEILVANPVNDIMIVPIILGGTPILYCVLEEHYFMPVYYRGVIRTYVSSGQKFEVGKVE
jgi:hypothetical protein